MVTEIDKNKQSYSKYLELQKCIIVPFVDWTQGPEEKGTENSFRDFFSFVVLSDEFI